MTLNPQQEEAVKTTEGRLLVLAGAGSGKTRVIIHRIAHLIKNCKVNPESILGLTFTNKAAEEMRVRLAKMIPRKIAKKVTLCTFHSFCMQVLRKEIERLGYTRNFSLYDEKDRNRLIKNLAHYLTSDDDPSSITPALNEISKARSSGDPSEINDALAKELFDSLQSSMRIYNAVDFDSLITLTLQLFDEHPDILEAYQDRFRYLMIDEYQDTNPPQYRLAEQLSAKYRNLCVVGDDDQSIYGWRGAKVSHILDFAADKKVKLEQNYRSTPNILNAANAVIDKNENRYKKRLWSDQKEGKEISVFCAPTDAEEVTGVVDRILAYRKNHGLLFKDMAVLYRSNVLSRGIEQALINASYQKDGQWVRGIPYEIYGGLEFSERSEIKDLFSYLKVIANPNDNESLLRILNVPRRGISDKTLDTLTKIQRERNIPLYSLLQNSDNETLTIPARRGIQSFLGIITSAQEHFKNDAMGTALQWLIDRISYQKAIQDEVQSEKARQVKWENVMECITAISLYEEENPNPSLQDFVSSSMLSQPRKKGEKKRVDRDCVQLMTFHSSKGLEFPACFIIGLEDTILPHEKSLLETGIEEERRLFYVGLTRAQKYLTLSMAKQRTRMGKCRPCTPSRFLFEIPKPLLAVSSWKTFA